MPVFSCHWIKTLLSSHINQLVFSLLFWIQPVSKEQERKNERKKERQSTYGLLMWSRDSTKASPKLHFNGLFYTGALFCFLLLVPILIGWVSTFEHTQLVLTSMGSQNFHTHPAWVLVLGLPRLQFGLVHGYLLGILYLVLRSI